MPSLRVAIRLRGGLHNDDTNAAHTWQIKHARSEGRFSKADARLIAAAPDLLAALGATSALLDALSDGYADIGADTRVIARRKEARAAITKARGEAAS